MISQVEFQKQLLKLLLMMIMRKKKRINLGWLI